MTLDFINKTLEIKDPPDFTVVSTFAGCGGSSTGYVWAGGRVLLAVEWDDNAVETYRANYPDTPIYHGDIAKLSVEECLAITGLRPGELDIFDGSPPCQGFSTAGKRDFNDTRNQLFHEYVRLLRGLRPKVFVMENVSGMVKGKMKIIFAEIMRELKASGYKVSARLLNAMYFGVPQSRQRMIFIGVRDDLGIEPSHPKAQTPPISVRRAWAGILNKGDSVKKVNLARFANINPGQNAYGSFESSYIRLFYDRPSSTITKGSYQVHPTDHRTLTGPELSRISSFPDCFRFIGDTQNAVDRIGNSVPPRFMQAIAEHIRDNILDGNKR